MKLSDQAFLPVRALNENARRAFIERRDSLYSYLSSEEQQCVLRLADWYAIRKQSLLPAIELLNRSSMAVSNQLLFPLHGLPKPNLLVRGLAQLNVARGKAEDRYSHWLHEQFISKIADESDVNAQEDTALGVLLFFRLLQVELGREWTRVFLEKRLTLAAQQWVKDGRVPPEVRLRAAIRSLLHEGNGRDLLDLRRLTWGLLLEVVSRDTEAAAAFVDEHWKSSGGSAVFFPLYFHESPELAYQLATRFRPFRREFSEEMLRQAIFNTALKLLGNDRSVSLGVAVDSLLAPMSALLVVWTLDTPGASVESRLRALDCLFRYGDPSGDYWTRLPSACLALIESISSEEQGQWLHLLAAASFYSDQTASTADAALRRFDHHVARELSSPIGNAPSGVVQVARKLDNALGLLEDKVLSHRNRHIPPNPQHPLMVAFENRLNTCRERWFGVNSPTAMQDLVALTLGLSSERLIRRHHEVLLREFPLRVQASPQDAGLALKRLIQYRGYSQTGDQMYRKQLCQDTFDALLPTLEKVSQADASVARSGIGWSPRGDI
ncbi:hypothetical protein [Hydrogenophaga sp.]|uniref:hypothetical protein n=1 Tax=Hydrogenophaga sp. TaxID=1904254 RepID=UPI002613E59B|nr:hypothetical protein [Hydrogenophaga sp.]MCW5653311.1 hypothetical protein [Hydrogenophaga sp.]